MNMSSARLRRARGRQVCKMGRNHLGFDQTISRSRNRAPAGGNQVNDSSDARRARWLDCMTFNRTDPAPLDSAQVMTAPTKASAAPDPRTAGWTHIAIRCTIARIRGVRNASSNSADAVGLIQNECRAGGKPLPPIRCRAFQLPFVSRSKCVGCVGQRLKSHFTQNRFITQYCPPHVGSSAAHRSRWRSGLHELQYVSIDLVHMGDEQTVRRAGINLQYRARNADGSAPPGYFQRGRHVFVAVQY